MAEEKRQWEEDFPYTYTYTWEILSPSLKICVTQEHKFGTDAFLLSHFAGARPQDLVCDLGTGCGIVPLLWFRQRQNAPKYVWGVEIQEKAVSQFVRTIHSNQLEDRLEALCWDIVKIGKKGERPPLPMGQLDLVTCNPPYKRTSAGILSQSHAEKIARHETLCTLEDVCRAAAALLRFGGRFCLCQRPERLADVLVAMRQNGLEAKRIRMVQQREGEAPWLFLVEGKRGSKPFLQIEPPLVVEDRQGGFSKELLDIYQK